MTDKIGLFKASKSVEAVLTIWNRTPFPFVADFRQRQLFKWVIDSVRDAQYGMKCVPCVFNLKLPHIPFSALKATNASIL